MDTNTQLQQASQLHYAGQDQAALEILYNIVQRDTNALLAWQVILKIAKDRLRQIGRETEKDVPKMVVELGEDALSWCYRSIQENNDNITAWQGVEHISTKRIEALTLGFRTPQTQSNSTYYTNTQSSNLDISWSKRPWTLIACGLIFISLFIPFAEFKFYASQITIFGWSQPQSFYEDLSVTQGWGTMGYILDNSDLSYTYSPYYLANDFSLSSTGKSKLWDRGAPFVVFAYILPILALIFSPNKYFELVRRLVGGLSILNLLGLAYLVLLSDSLGTINIGFFTYLVGSLVLVGVGLAPTPTDDTKTLPKSQ